MSRDERGSITPLVIGFFLVLATLVAVVVDASAAYLERQGLDALADATALAATEGLQGDQVYTTGLGERAGIDAAAAADYATAYLRETGAFAKHPGLRVRVETHSNAVLVRLAGPLDLPLHVPGIPLQTTVTGTASSVVVVTD